jgi:glycosyltransferase involved in cell wall biosynthesis
MKIVFVTLGYRPVRLSGLDVSGERLVNALLQAGHEVTVLAGGQPGILEDHNHPRLKIYRIPIGKSDWIAFAYRAARLLPKLRPFDVVHFWDVHFGWAYRGSFVASLHHSFHQRLKSLKSYPQGYPILLFRYLYYSSARTLAEIPSIKRANGFLAVSNSTRDEFLAEYAVTGERVIVAPHGIDTCFFRPSPSVNEWRNHLNLNASEPVILFAGFITPRKGLDTLARAFLLLPPGPRLLLVGKWRSEAYRRYVLDLLEPAKDRVIEVGFIPDEQLPLYYSLADVYVSTSLLEGFGLPLAEALACETPVVAVNAGSVAEVVGPGGILLQDDNPATLARAISDLLANSELQRELGRRGREHIQENFSIEAMLENTLAAYRRFS